MRFARTRVASIALGLLASACGDPNFGAQLPVDHPDETEVSSQAVSVTGRPIRTETGVQCPSTAIDGMGCWFECVSSNPCVIDYVVCPICYFPTPTPPPMPPMPSPMPVPPQQLVNAMPADDPNNPTEDCDYLQAPIRFGMSLIPIEIPERQSLPLHCGLEGHQGNFSAFPPETHRFLKASNIAEWAFAATNIVVANAFYKLSRVAAAESNRRWQNNPYRNGSGPENAFRHAYWNALMTWGYGEMLAKEAADRHEKFLGPETNPPKEEEMDLFNNNIGRQLGKWFSPTQPVSGLADYIYQRCIVERACMWICTESNQSYRWPGNTEGCRNRVR